MSVSLSLVDELGGTNTAAHELAEYAILKDAFPGTVVLEDKVRTRTGALVPATHVRSGWWWIQHLDADNDPDERPKTLLITGHAPNIADGTNALLALNSVGFAQGGSYSIVVTSAYGSATNGPVNLTVVDTVPPLITACAPNTTISADLSCSATMAKSD